MIRHSKIERWTLVFVLLSVPSCAENRDQPAGESARGETWSPGRAGSQMESCVVTKIIDGDTIHCEPVGRIRFIGMDTPERGQKPYGPMATAALAELAPVGSEVSIEFDVERQDRYDRILGYVWAGNEMVNWRLVRDGYALLATYPPNVAYVDHFIEAQRVAREEAVGLWAVSGFECTPADYRRQLCR